jgi:PAS domain S-box-containing protein
MRVNQLRRIPTLVGSMLDSLPEGIILADARGEILFANRVARRMAGGERVGVPPSEWSRSYGFFVPFSEEPFPADQLPLARAIRGEEVRDVEVFVRNAGAPEGAWVSVSGAPILDEEGTLSGGVVVFRDITGDKAAEELSRRLASAVEQTADTVMITDRSGTIEYVNPAFERTTGYSREEVLGQTPRLLKSGAQGPEYYQDMWNTILGGGTFRGTTVNRKKNGDLYYAEQSITPMTNDEGQISHFVSVLKDMTERRKIQEQEVEMQVASRVQRLLFPDGPPRCEGYDIAGAVFPAQETCGDYYDFVPIPAGSLGIVIADVCGHGVGPALVMAETRAWVHALSRTVSGPAGILDELNQVLFDDLDEVSFVTMLLAYLDQRSGRLTYASAGHPEGYIVNESGTVRRTLGSTGVPLGMFSERRYSCGDGLVLGAGELLVLVTDGILESEAPDGTEFGAERLLEVVRQSRQLPAREIVDRVESAVRAFVGDSLRTDDLSIVICKRDS